MYSMMVVDEPADEKVDEKAALVPPSPAPISETEELKALLTNPPAAASAIPRVQSGGEIELGMAALASVDVAADDVRDALLISGRIEEAGDSKRRYDSASALSDAGVFAYCRDKRINVVRCAASADDMTCAELARHLTDFFSAFRARSFVVVYSGHGQRDTGDWVLAQGQNFSLERLSSRLDLSGMLSARCW